MPSLDSLLITVHAVTARNLNAQRISEVNVKALVADARRYMMVRDRLASRIVEIPYAEIRGDAPRAAAGLYERAGIAFDDETKRRFGDFAAANRQHSRGVHSYKPEDFGQTLGYWGAGPGPYLVIPVLGPSNVRDATGLTADSLLLWAITPAVVYDSYALTGVRYGLQAIDTRHRTAFRYFETGSPFEYDLVRLIYTEKRKLDIGD